MKWLERFADPVHVLLRILAGALFAFHGVQHLFGVLAPARAAAGSQVWTWRHWHWNWVSTRPNWINAPVVLLPIYPHSNLYN